MTTYWFKPKTHGYGAYPTTWHGWALIAVFVLGQLALAHALLPAAGGSIGPWLAGSALMTVTFIWVSKVKTDGDWRWRWPGHGGNEVRDQRVDPGR